MDSWKEEFGLVFETNIPVKKSKLGPGRVMKHAGQEMINDAINDLLHWFGNLVLVHYIQELPYPRKSKDVLACS